MKRFLLAGTFLFYLLTGSSQSTCNIAAIDAAAQSHGYILMNVQNEPCSRYYYNPTTTSSWVTAENQAVAMNGHLVTIKDSLENVSVQAGAIVAGASSLVFMGYTDFAVEGTWVWVDGTNTGYTYWNSGEPSNSSNFPCYTDEDAGMMQVSNGAWSDRAYANLCPFNTYASLIEVDLCPVVNATANTPACPGSPRKVYASTQFGSPAYSYVWKQLPAGTQIGTGDSVTVSPNVNTLYQLQVTDHYSCTAKDTVNVVTKMCTAPPGCNLQAVRDSFAAHNYVELDGITNPCSLYFINPVSQDANLAELSAQQLGAHMVSIQSAQENQQILDALIATGHSPNTIAVWLGVTDQVLEGTFVNLDQSPLGYTHWDVGEPNNFHPACCANSCSTTLTCTAGEDCVQMRVSGLWNDLPCDYTSISIVEVSLCPQISSANDTTVCIGNPVQLFATAILGSTPYTFHWNPGNAIANPYVVNPPSSTDYALRVSDRYGCYTDDTVHVTTNGGALQSFTANPSAVCSGLPVTITYTGGSNASATYTWNFAGATVASGSGSGPYQISWNSFGNYNVTLDVTDNACVAPQVVHQVVVNANLSANAGNDVTVCSGGSIQLGAATTAGHTYQWTPALHLSDDTIANPVYSFSNTTGSSITTQYIVYEAANGCDGYDTVNVTLNSIATTTISASGAVTFCNGDSVTLTADSAYTSYLWNNSSITNSITVSLAGNFTMNAADANGCEHVSNSITVAVNPNPTLALVSSTIETCFGFADGSITVNSTTGTAAFNYVWNTAPVQSTSTASNLSAGTYSVTVTDANQCVDSAAYSITSPSALLLAVNNVTDASCFAYKDASIILSATGGTTPYHFVWSTGGTDSTLANIGAGNYTVTLSDANNCSADSLFNITEPVEIIFQNMVFDSVKYNDNVVLNTAVQPAGTYTYQWNPTQYLSCSNCAAPTFSGVTSTPYQVTVTDATGCYATGTITVNVIANKPLFIPNAFTPNGDGQNDKWLVGITGTNYFNVIVFNRWGEKVFESNNVNEGWDGTYQGKDAYAGVYTYVMLVTFQDGENRKYRGGITLLR